MAGAWKLDPIIYENGGIEATGFIVRRESAPRMRPDASRFGFTTSGTDRNRLNPTPYTHVLFDVYQQCPGAHWLIVTAAVPFRGLEADKEHI